MKSARNLAPVGLEVSWREAGGRGAAVESEASSVHRTRHPAVASLTVVAAAASIRTPATDNRSVRKADKRCLKRQQRRLRKSSRTVEWTGYEPSVR